MQAEFPWVWTKLQFIANIPKEIGYALMPLCHLITTVWYCMVIDLFKLECSGVAYIHLQMHQWKNNFKDNVLSRQRKSKDCWKQPLEQMKSVSTSCGCSRQKKKKVFLEQATSYIDMLLQAQNGICWWVCRFCIIRFLKSRGQYKEIKSKFLNRQLSEL